MAINKTLAEPPPPADASVSLTSKTIEVRNGLKFTFPVPADVATFDTLAKRVGACLEGAISDTAYRGVLPDIWEALAYRLSVDNPSIVRETKDAPGAKPDDKGKVRQVPKLSDPQFVDHVAATLGVDATTFQSIVDDITTNGWDYTDDAGKVTHLVIAFDPSVRERVAKIVKPTNDDIAVAKDLIAQGTDGLATSLSKISVMTKSTYDATGKDGDALVAVVALAVREYRLAKAKLANAQTKSELAA